MLRFVSVTAILLASAAPALAQRTNENAVASAQDAFGTSVGNERVGLYSPGIARGFSPVQAGNVRINGLYFDYQTDLNDRLISGSNVRVGLTALGYPFPAPTGVADFSLRLPGSETVASTVVGFGPFGGARAEVDAQLPITDTLAVAAGVGVNAEESNYGGDRLFLTAAAARRSRSSLPRAPISRPNSSASAISARNGRRTGRRGSTTAFSPPSDSATGPCAPAPSVPFRTTCATSIPCS